MSGIGQIKVRPATLAALRHRSAVLASLFTCPKKLATTIRALYPAAWSVNCESFSSYFKRLLVSLLLLVLLSGHTLNNFAAKAEVTAASPGQHPTGPKSTIASRQAVSSIKRQIGLFASAACRELFLHSAACSDSEARCQGSMSVRDQRAGEAEAEGLVWLTER